MKRKRTSLVILLAVFLLLSGWLMLRITNDSSKEASALPQASSAPDYETETPAEESLPVHAPSPPHCLRFDDLKAYQDFFFAAELEDSEFRKYIQRKSFDMNGIESKEDLNALTSSLLPVPFPVVTGARLTSVEILSEYNQLHLRYAYGQDVCTFRIDYTDLHPVEDAFAVEENLQLWNEAAFDAYSYDEKQNEHQFKEEINGCTVCCRYDGAEAQARAIIEKSTIFVSAVKPLKETSDLTMDGFADLPIKEPDCLSFQSMETYWGLFLSADQPDDRFMMYIEKTGLDMNGIRSKRDLFSLTAKLLAVPFPLVRDADLLYAEILPEYNEISLQYAMRSGDVCTFVIDYSELPQTEQLLQLEENLQSWDNAVSDDYAYFVSQQAGTILEESIQPWNETAFDDYSYDEKQNAHQYRKVGNGCSVCYTYYGSEADARLTIEENTQFISAAGFSVKKGG